MLMRSILLQLGGPVGAASNVLRISIDQDATDLLRWPDDDGAQLLTTLEDKLERNSIFEVLNIITRPTLTHQAPLPNRFTCAYFGC